MVREVKYHQFNKKIGSGAAQMKYKDIPKGPLRNKISMCSRFCDIGGSDIQKTLDKLMLSTFPQWSRLHFYWRTDPHYNTFWSGKEPNSLPPKSISPKRTSKVATTGTIVSQKKPTVRYCHVQLPGTNAHLLDLY